MSWERVGKAVDKRISDELNMTKSGVARSAKADVSNLWKLRNGHGSELSEAMIGRFEQALRWPSGTITDIYNGGEPPSEVLSDPERLERVEDEIANLSRRFGDLESKLRRLLDGP